jgi:hypothetical protein
MVILKRSTDMPDPTTIIGLPRYRLSSCAGPSDTKNTSAMLRYMYHLGRISDAVMLRESMSLLYKKKKKKKEKKESHVE